jgi:Prokaryotic Cytochrome C oxidase subunit IV
MSSASAERIWLLLLGLTAAGAWLGENGGHGWALTLTVAFLIAFKGRLVIDHYMGMRDANRTIRRVLYAFVVVIPALVVASHAFGSHIARWTTLR